MPSYKFSEGSVRKIADNNRRQELTPYDSLFVEPQYVPERLPEQTFKLTATLEPGGFAIANRMGWNGTAYTAIATSPPIKLYDFHFKNFGLTNDIFQARQSPVSGKWEIVGAYGTEHQQVKIQGATTAGQTTDVEIVRGTDTGVVIADVLADAWLGDWTDDQIAQMRFDPYHDSGPTWILIGGDCPSA